MGLGIRHWGLGSGKSGAAGTLIYRKSSRIKRKLLELIEWHEYKI